MRMKEHVTEGARSPRSGPSSSGASRSCGPIISIPICSTSVPARC
jgi:hypothetical protein